MLDYDDGEPGQSIFLCLFVNLPCSTVLGIEKGERFMCRRMS